MRQPPPVSVRCAGGRLWQALGWVLPALAAGAAVHWALGHLDAGSWLAVAAALGAAGLTAGWLLRTRPAVPVDLCWDGSRWTAAGQPVEPRLRIDLGGWLLLQLHPAAGASAAAPRWAAIAAGEAPQAWHALRVAVLASRGAAADGPRAHV